VKVIDVPTPYGEDLLAVSEFRAKRSGREGCGDRGPAGIVRRATRPTRNPRQRARHRPAACPGVGHGEGEDRSSNVAVTVVVADSVTVHEPGPEQPPPLHPAKSEPAAMAVSVTAVPLG